MVPRDALLRGGVPPGAAFAASLWESGAVTIVVVTM